MREKLAKKAGVGTRSPRCPLDLGINEWSISNDSAYSCRWPDRIEWKSTAAPHRRSPRYNDAVVCLHERRDVPTHDGIGSQVTVNNSTCGNIHALLLRGLRAQTINLSSNNFKKNFRCAHIRFNHSLYPPLKDTLGIPRCSQSMKILNFQTFYISFRNKWLQRLIV